MTSVSTKTAVVPAISVAARGQENVKSRYHVQEGENVVETGRENEVD